MVRHAVQHWHGARRSVGDGRKFVLQSVKLVGSRRRSPTGWAEVALVATGTPDHAFTHVDRQLVVGQEVGAEDW